MYLKKIAIPSGKPIDPPEIHWEEDDKYAIIAFLLLSIDKKADNDGLVRFDDLFGLNETAPEPEGNEDGETYEQNAKQEARDTIIRECEKFLAGLDADERYDAVQDEIDKFIEGEDGYNLKCAIGDSYSTFGGSMFGVISRKKLDSGNYRLWDLVKLVVFDPGYQGNKKRLLKHLARKWDIEGAVLPAFEKLAKTLSAISREQRELTEGDKPFREVKARLAELETQEKEAWKALYKLGVSEDRTASALGESFQGSVNAALSLLGLVDPDLRAEIEKEILEDEDGEEEDEEEEEEDCEEGEAKYTLGDEIIARVSDGAASFLNKIADALDNFGAKLG